ncbi:hypothetical protein GL2_41660 [Microbulbifer sp. GL-2]|nr:hypothetical protein GL2_41660 [Microbulbifer sp. GL-2]
MSNPGGIVFNGEESANNGIINNLSQGNFEFDLWDDFDPGGCSSSNIWLLNTACTAEPSCLNWLQLF